MAVNRSENKIPVVPILGGSSAIGLIDPLVNLTTNRGVIVSRASGDYTVQVSGQGVGIMATCHPWELQVSQTVATGTWSFPTGDGSVKFGRSGYWPGGVPDLANSGIRYSLGANEVVTVYDNRFI